MAGTWQDEMALMLRIIIGDMSNSPTYTNLRLEQLLAVSAHFVIQELDFDNTYTVSISPVSISPNPIGTGETAFTNFVVLKAACLADQSTFRTKALVSGVRAKCGPAVLETLKHIDGFKELLTVGPCAAYEKLKENWIFGNAELVKAILSPFVGNNFDPMSLNGGRHSSRVGYFS